MSQHSSDDLEIEKIGELDEEIETADLERDSKVKTERGRLYEISLLPTNAKILSLVGVFVIAALIFLLIAVFALKQSAFVACVVLMVQAGVAVLLEQADLSVHGIVVVVEIVAGVLIHTLWLMVLAAVIYIGAVAVIKMSQELQKRDE